MGCGSSKSSGFYDMNIDNIRVVHLDGRIEDYDVPIRVNKVIKNPENDVLCTRSQLLCPTSIKALKSDCELQLGNLYFLIPISTFTCEASVMDMAHMVNKLTNIAKSTPRMKEDSSPEVGHEGTGHESSSPSRVESDTSSNLERCVWKPVLDTIRERSLNGRSESNLQDRS